MLLSFMLIRFVVIVGVNVLCVMFYFLMSMGMVKLINWLLKLFMMIVKVVSSIVIFCVKENGLLLRIVLILSVVWFWFMLVFVGV